MTEAQSISAKYVFLDVVKYSYRRSVEAQTDIISTLNQLVRESVEGFEIPTEKLLYLPTGDGICIALLGVDSPYDLHIQLPLAILAKLLEYNQETFDEMRQFKIRIGLNENLDNLVTDINGQRNVSGGGINLAQRVMNTGDGNQIMLGTTVFETFRQRQKYMRAFASFRGVAKHGIPLHVHQLTQPSPGLDTSVPSAFVSTPEAEPRLNKRTAYYFSHAIKNREVLKTSLHEHGLGQGASTWVVLLYMLARDSAGASSASDINPHDPVTWGANRATLAEQFDYYNAIDFQVIYKLSDFIQGKFLSKFSRYFESSILSSDDYHFITQEGREKLKAEWPTIWKEFGFLSTQ